MRVLDQQAARDYINASRPHKPGTYNPAKYVLLGWLDCTEREVLELLYKKAHASMVEARREVQSRRSVKLNTHGSGVPKVWQRHPRDVSVMVPLLRRVGDGYFVFTNCKLNRWTDTPAAETEPASRAFRRTQRHYIP